MDSEDLNIQIYSGQAMYDNRILTFKFCSSGRLNQLGKPKQNWHSKWLQNNEALISRCQISPPPVIIAPLLATELSRESQVYSLNQSRNLPSWELACPELRDASQL